MKHPHRRSRNQERRVADRTGGRRTPGSGNGWDRKNDVRTGEQSFELKVTDKKQYTLKLDELESGERYALLDGREFVFGVEIAGRRYVVLTEDDYYDLRGIDGPQIS